MMTNKRKTNCSEKGANHVEVTKDPITLLVSNNSVTKVAILELKIDPLKIVFIKF